MPNGYLVGGKPDIAYWRAQVQAGIEYRRRVTHEARWDIWRKMYRGEWAPGVLPSNLFFRMARTIVPRIYFRNPAVSVTPKKPGMLYWAFAQLLERIDNKMIRQMKVKQSTKRVVQNAWMFGTGIAKLGFGGEFNFSPNPFGTTSAPTSKRGERVEYKSSVTENMPWFASTHTGNFIVPAGCQDIDEARWVGEWHRRTVADMRDDPRFNKSMPDDKLLSGLGFNPYVDISRKTYKEVEPMMDFVEIRDRKTKQVFIISMYSGFNDALIVDSDELQVFGHLPYYPVVFNQDDQYFWGVPDTHILEPQQLELNEIRTQEMKHRRMSLVRILAQRLKIKEDEAAKMVSEYVSPVIWTEGIPANTVHIFEGSDIPDGLIKMEAAVMQDVREQMGFSRNEFGENNPSSSRISAEETRIVKAATEIRLDERRDMMADMLVSFVEDMNQVIFNNWTDDIILDVIGPMGVPLWIKFRPDLLKGTYYNVNIDPDTALPETRDIRQQKAIVTYQLLSSNPLIDPIRLTRYLLHELHGVQFDDMMRGMPPGLGGPEIPLDIEQYIGLVQQVASKAPQALTAGPPLAQPINPTMFE